MPAATAICCNSARRIILDELWLTKQRDDISRVHQPTSQVRRKDFSTRSRHVKPTFDTAFWGSRPPSWLELLRTPHADNRYTGTEASGRSGLLITPAAVDGQTFA